MLFQDREGNLQGMLEIKKNDKNHECKVSSSRQKKRNVITVEYELFITTNANFWLNIVHGLWNIFFYE